MLEPRPEMRMAVRFFGVVMLGPGSATSRGEAHSTDARAAGTSAGWRAGDYFCWMLSR